MPATRTLAIGNANVLIDAGSGQDTTIAIGQYNAIADLGGSDTQMAIGKGNVLVDTGGNDARVVVGKYNAITDTAGVRQVFEKTDVKFTIDDPMSAHFDQLAKYTDKDMHDVTAYLVTLK